MCSFRQAPCGLSRIGGVLVCLVAVGRLSAATVKTSVSASETYVGVPVTLQISIENAKTHDPPEVPAIAHVEVRSGGVPSRSTSMTNMNGVVNRRETLTYAYRLIPKRAGRVIIPALTIRADGKEHRTQPRVIVVSKSETGDLLFVEVEGTRDSLYVGESLDVTLKIWLKPYYDRRFQMKLNEGHMWSRLDLENSEWGVFLDPLKEMLSQRRRPRGQEQIRKDSQGNEHSYYVYDIKTTFWPERAGQLEVGDVRVLVGYPTRLERDRSPFSRGGNLRLVDLRPISASVSTAATRVKPIPTEGRPSHFCGAVGRYRISTEAKPTEMAVGDPITLTLTVAGIGRLETLQSPPLLDIQELTDDFKIPTDPLAGEVVRKQKRFTQTIRARNDSVQAIPAIPFVYFDPRQEQFVTVRSKPIPLKVTSASGLPMQQIVDASGNGRSRVRQLTERAGGILANYTDMDDVLRQQAFALGWSLVAILTLSPFLFVICWFSRRYYERMTHDVGFARRRSAKRTAMRRIRTAQEVSGAQSSAILMGALSGYVADRCNLPAGGLTRMEIVERLRHGQVPGHVVEQVDDVLSRCESQQYAGSNDDVGAKLVDDAMRCIGDLERQSF